MKRFGNRLPIAVLLLALGMSSISCTRKESFDNPFDPNVSVLPPRSLKVLSMTDSSLTIQWSSEYNILASAQKAASAIVVEQSFNDTTFSIIDSLSAADTSGTVRREFQTNKLYFFRVYAAIGAKKTDFSNVVKVNLSFIAPTNFEYTTVTEAKREFTWQYSGGLASYIRIQRKLGDGGTYSTIRTVPAGTTTLTDTSVILTDTTYYYRICAVSGSGTLSPYDSLSIYLDFPSPTGLHMTCLSPTSVQLAWTDSSSFETGYVLLSSANNQPFAEIAKFPTNDSAYTLDNLDSSNSYRLRIEAYSQYNRSGYSQLSISYVPSRDHQSLYTTHVQPDNAWIYSLAFSPDGRTLACGGNYIGLLRAGDGKPLVSSPTVLNNVNITSLEYSPDGKSIVGVWSGYVHLWDPKTNSEIGRFGAEAGPSEVWSCGYSISGDSVIAATPGGIQILQTDNMNMVRKYPSFDNPSQTIHTPVAVSPNDQYVATGDTLTLLRLSDGSVVRIFPSYSSLGTIVFDPAGNLIACASIYYPHDIQLWSVSSGSLVRSINENYYVGKYPNDLAFSPDGKLLAAAGNQNASLDIFNVQTGALVASLANSSQCISVAFSPLGNILAAGDSRGNVHVWSLVGSWKTDF